MYLRQTSQMRNDGFSLVILIIRLTGSVQSDYIRILKQILKVTAVLKNIIGNGHMSLFLFISHVLGYNFLIQHLKCQRNKCIKFHEREITFHNVLSFFEIQSDQWLVRDCTVSGIWILYISILYINHDARRAHPNHFKYFELYNIIYFYIYT